VRTSPSLGLLTRIAVSVLFPFVLGASGCCGCPVGLCSSIFRGMGKSSPPSTGPFGLGGGGGMPGISVGAGGSGGGEEQPLSPEQGEPGRAASRENAKNPSLRVPKGTPIRGALLAGPRGKTTFVPHSAESAAPVGDGSSFVVAGATGLWEHDTTTLEKRERLVPGPILDVATSPDGKKIAYALEGGRVRVVAYPGLSSLTSANVDEPTRMRFSQDGKLLALASQADTITLLDVATGKTQVFDTDEDVNDVAPMPDNPAHVAYASDDDEFAIGDVARRRKVFGTAPLVEAWRRSSRPGFIMRDQLAVAYDPVTKTLLGGGDDNLVWRVDDVRGAPSLRPPIEVGGNVVEIACCAGKSDADRAAYVAVDDLRVRAVALDGRLGPQFGPIMSSVGSFRIRIALLPSGDVLVVPQNAVFRWEPRTGVALRSNDYAMPALAQQSALDADTVYVACDVTSCAVQRVQHGPPKADVEATILGDVPGMRALAILPFGDGTRAIAVARASKLRLVYLPPGGALEAPIDTPAMAGIGGHFAKRDGTMHGYLDANGDVYEILASPRVARKVGSVSTADGITAFEWDTAKKRWRIDHPGGAEEFVP